MKIALQIFSWVAVVLGILAIIGAAGQPTPAEVTYSLTGGALFLTQGILALAYIASKEK
jgi:hypothetical protein